MSDESKDNKHYELDPHEEPEAAAPPPGTPAEPAPPAKPPPEPHSIKALDICPNCGSPLGGIDSVVCLRCGFDLKSLKVIKTETGEAAVAEPGAEEPEPAEPLSASGNGDLWLPGAMAIGGLGLLTVGFLWGSRGLISVETGETITLGARLEGLVRMLVRTAVMTLAGLGGLHFLAHILETRVGDLKLAAARMLGIVAAIGLLTFFNVNAEPLEWTIEAVTQAAAFVGLAMVIYRLSARDAATLLGITVLAVISLLLVSALVIWAARPS